MRANRPRTRQPSYELRWQRHHHVALCDCGWVSEGMTTPGMAGATWDAHAAEVHVGDDVVLTTPAELDAATVADLRTRIGAALADDARRGAVVLEMAPTTFIDACGLGTLVWFANEAERFGRTTGLLHTGRMVTWLLALSGVDRRFASPSPLLALEAAERRSSPVRTRGATSVL